MRKTLFLNGIELEITYYLLPQENRNSGHPDSRLPNEPMEITIESVDVVDWNNSELTKLIKEQSNEYD